LISVVEFPFNYSPPGETIEVGFEHLKSPEIEFFVNDKGPGIPPESQKAIFNKSTTLTLPRQGGGDFKGTLLFPLPWRANYYP